MKTFKHKKTGEIATYKDNVLTSSGFSVEIGVEPSSEFWEEIVEGNTYYIVEGSLLEPYKIKKFKNNTTIYPGDVIFTTKEEAEEYIILNKPCLSIKDIAPIIGFCNNTTYVDLDLLTEKLKKLVKSKI
jgi:hypothetical protein